MKSIFLLFTVLLFCHLASAQLIAIVQMDKHIDGICNEKEVYALYHGFTGQKEAICPISQADIIARLNNEVPFLKSNPKLKAKGMVGMFVNCKGEAVDCTMDNTTKNKELDDQIVNVFKSLRQWQAGTYNGKGVDSHVVWSIRVKGGQITIE